MADYSSNEQTHNNKIKKKTMSLNHEFIINQKCQLPRLKLQEAKRVYIPNRT